MKRVISGITICRECDNDIPKRNFGNPVPEAKCGGCGAISYQWVTTPIRDFPYRTWRKVTQPYRDARDYWALRLGIWALRTIYGECKTYVWDDFPGEDVKCASCDATKVIRDMREMLDGAE